MTFIIITALAFVFVLAFAGLVMWAIIHIQNQLEQRDHLARRLQPRN